MSRMAPFWVTVFTLGTQTLASPFDPHPNPPASSQPFFDGWFTRIVDHRKGFSLAVITGRWQPPHKVSYNSTWLSLLYKQHDSNETKTEQHFLESDDVRIVPRSDARSGVKSSWLWQSSTWGTLEVDDDTATLDLRFDSLRVRAQLSRRVPWDSREPDSAGPEDWVVKYLPVPCHYYVHTLASATKYDVRFSDNSHTRGSGFAHMETNYGRVFPTAWIWSQAIDQVGTTQLVLTAGRFVELPVPDVAVVALRSPRLKWTFRTTDLNPISVHMNASCGWVSLTARNLFAGLTVEVNVTAPSGSFSQPIFVPTKGGWSSNPGSVESYSSVASIAAYEHGELIEAHTISFAALEFGGGFRAHEGFALHAGAQPSFGHSDALLV